MSMSGSEARRSERNRSLPTLKVIGTVLTCGEFGNGAGQVVADAGAGVIREATRQRRIAAIGAAPAERAWRLGRESPKERRGDAFDLKAWHMAAFSQGSLGLDDLIDELSQL
ncbi:hypothetical protein AB0L33_05410 [Streptomyces sp. NPDC052299]|uniref:hypothetical protein n=1 Tax=Streptomyces sp. NPDC052299 TaxID=3155054 RepID=UPI003415E337